MIILLLIGMFFLSIFDKGLPKHSQHENR